MPVFFCRWPNGDFSVVEATDEEDAIEALDEVANADGVPLIEVEDFRLLMTLRLSTDGRFLLEHVGEHLLEPFWEKMYPVLFDAQEKDAKAIRKAVIKERRRVKQARAPSPDTEVGKELQRVLDVPVSLANKEVTRRAKEVLRKASAKGKPQ